MKIQTYLSTLVHKMASSNHRVGLCVQGSQDWQSTIIKHLSDLFGSGNKLNDAKHQIFKLGATDIAVEGQTVAFNKGQQLLGQECSLLIVDCLSGFDANSFSSALGTLRGGGILVILNAEHLASTLSSAWVTRSFESLISLVEDGVFPALPDTQLELPADLFSEQKHAINLIEKVVTGHRKRPLVLTADRGRGKTSALGMAAAKLMRDRKIHIVITAPSFACVQPLFQHAQKALLEGKLQRGYFTYQTSVLEFVAPDELLARQLECDFLMVDEASAIPIPMLKRMTERYHRCVFSSTIHGYEGCGRGFTLKFQQWLRVQRPACTFFHMQQPIRWNRNDPLEMWHYQTFLLDADMEELTVDEVSLDNISLVPLSKQTLFDSPALLRSCFSLLVNAHYQTSPNDLMLLLSDDAMMLHAVFSDQVCIGCIVSVVEGELEKEVVLEIQQGRRRPKGHLAPVTLANQLGITEAALQKSLRVMRIAVHPQLQHMGLGSNMLKLLEDNTNFEFYSTSFGATNELVSFWQANGYVPVRLGVQRDHSSGCHSLLMVKGTQAWISESFELFKLSFDYSLSELFVELEVEMVRSMFSVFDSFSQRSVDAITLHPLIENYLSGGAGFETVAPLLAIHFQNYPATITFASDLVVRKLLQRRSWQQCSSEFGLSGKGQTEKQLRQDIKQLFL